MSTLPVYYYTSTILTADDDSLFTQALSKILSKEFKVKSFQQPEQLIDYINTHHSLLSKQTILRDCCEHDEYDTANHALVDLDVPALHSLQSNPERNDDVSVIIVDYNMPSMTGLEACQQLKNSRAKKILLTGESDLQIAIDAFNHKLIDKYIRKDSTSIANDIMTSVRELSMRYFLDQTQPILTHLEAGKQSPLSDEIFTQFFHQWCKENGIKEFTLIDKSGTFSVINTENQEAYFVLHTDNSLNTFIEINDDVADAAPYLDAMKSRTRIPFFGVGVDSWQVEPEAWDQYCHPANTFTGRQPYYWALVNH